MSDLYNITQKADSPTIYINKVTVCVYGSHTFHYNLTNFESSDILSVSNTYTNGATKDISSVSNTYTNGATLPVSQLEQILVFHNTGSYELL